MTISFSGHQFSPAMIPHAVWLYVRFTLTYRDVEDLLAERGLDVSYETGRRWVLKFGPMFAQELRGSRLQPDAVDAPVLYEGGVWPSGRECRAEEAAANREVGRNETMGDSPTESPQPGAPPAANRVRPSIACVSRTVFRRAQNTSRP